MRPTGKLHLGHYVGALENWVNLQKDHDNFHLIADYHVLTTQHDTSEIRQNTLDMLLDWLAAGIDPGQSPIFRQSAVKEHTELFLLLSMLVTSARLERNPTLKAQVRDLHLENMSYGHLGYPVLQAADILLYRGEAVPIGEDQGPHVEIARELARRFNRLYGKVFPLPEAMLTKYSRLPGLHGKSKMSKSLNNVILMSDDPATIAKRLKPAFTDPLKLRKHDPGRPDICLVFTYHTRFNSAGSGEIRSGCESGRLGCVDCKVICATAIADVMQPVRERRKVYENRPADLMDILLDGEQRAGEVARQTMGDVHDAMQLG
ncbi:MAG: tryptophan--tRNA ligase [Candidatus Marinimicrobia bacterium]|nr:tryptophan--tRNA ligase [Candidatus Neomarinimicrobiota bacterium]